MSTRNFNNPSDAQPPEDFEIPSCTIEDVDRSLFDLFNNQLPFNYKQGSGTRRVPVIFATGERFAVLRRKEPLRDKSGALILPLISIMRKSITQAPTMGQGTNQTAEHVIKRKLTKEDPLYQRYVNSQNLQNSDDLASTSALIKTDGRGAVSGSLPGRIASRSTPQNKSLSQRRGLIMDANLGKNIFEVITMRPPKYFTATYEVTFWANYTVQMNDMMSSLMSLYQSFGQRTFKLETQKGYWFVGYVGEDLSPDNNFDDFTDNERLVRCSFEVQVPAYLIGDAYPGAQKTLRRYVSAPMIDFSSNITNLPTEDSSQRGIPSGDPQDYILDDLRTIDEPLPGQSIGASSGGALNDSRRVSEGRSGAEDRKSATASVVAATTKDTSLKYTESETNPFTGNKEITETIIKSRDLRSGETILIDIIKC